MTQGYINKGQRVANQPEDNFQAGIAVNNLPSVAGGKLKVSNIPIGAVALASIGTNTTGVAGQLWVTDIWIPVNRLITKIGFLQGGTATTDFCCVSIYDSRGTLLGNSAVSGVVLSGANTFQEQTLLAAVQLYGPGQYYIAVHTSATTAGDIQTVNSPYLDICAGSVAGTFSSSVFTIPASITVPTTFTANKAPVVYVL